MLIRGKTSSHDYTAKFAKNGFPAGSLAEMPLNKKPLTFAAFYWV